MTTGEKLAAIIDRETWLPQLVAALRAVRDFGGKGETEDGTSVSFLVEDALRKAGEL